MTESSMTQMVTAFFSFLTFCVGTVATVWIRQMDQNQEKRSISAAVATNEVKATLSTNSHTVVAGLDHLTNEIGEVKQTGLVNHTLLNSKMGDQLRITALALARVLDLKKKLDPESVTTEDEQAYEYAQKLYKEHQERQAVVDTQVVDYLKTGSFPTS